MKTAILTISIALASALSALAQTVMRENSTVYFKTNVFLHDDPTNPLHQRISVEGKEPLWVAASNQVVYYQGGEITNASIHARYLYSTNATLLHANIHATALNAQNIQLGVNSVNKYYEEPYPECIAMFDGGATRYIFAPSRYTADLRQNIPIDPYFFPIWLGGIKGDGIVSSNGTLAVESNLVVGSGEIRLGSDNAWIKTDGTNLFFVSTVPPGFTNALTTNTP